MTFTLRRKSRRHTPRHVALLSAPDDDAKTERWVAGLRAEDAATQAIPASEASRPAQELDAQLRAIGARPRSSAPAAPAAFVRGTEPPEDDPRGPVRQPMFPEHGATRPARHTPTGPQRTAPSGTHPFDAPVTRTGPNGTVRYAPPARPRTARHTEAWTPDFAEQGQRPRPYGPRGNPIRPLPPEYPKAAPQIRARHAVTSGVRVERLAYPVPDGFSRHAREYAELMRHVSLATGTHSRYENPAAWGAATIAIGGAE